MKNKKILIPIIILVLLALVLMYFINIKISLNECIDNTIKYKDKINYNTNITLQMISYNTSLKIEYNIKKSNNIKYVLLKNYEKEQLTNSIEKYIINQNNEVLVYVNNNGVYEKQINNEEFYVNYELLKKNMKKIKKIAKDEYQVKLSSHDAYNLIYENQISTNEISDNIVDVNIKIDEENDFIKEISYTIDNLIEKQNNDIKYIVSIYNTNINNDDVIKLPFDK